MVGGFKDNSFGAYNDSFFSTQFSVMFITRETGFLRWKKTMEVYHADLQDRSAWDVILMTSY